MSLTAAERSHVRQHFTRRLSASDHVDVYWLPSQRNIAVRAVGAEKVWPLPDEARHIGTYSHPFPAAEFLGDLDDVLEQIRIEHERDASGHLAAA